LLSSHLVIVIFPQIFTYSGGKSPLSCCAFVSETTVLCGAEDGVMSQVDLRKTE